MDQSYNVVCLGTSAADIVVLGADELPRVSERMLVDEAKIRVGGSAVNTAIALKKLAKDELNVSCIAPIGGRLVGQHMRQMLKGLYGIKLPFRQDYCKDHFMTPISVVLLDEQREPRFYHAPYGNSKLSIRDLTIPRVRVAIQNADWLHLGGFGLLMSLEGRADGRLKGDPKAGAHKFERWLAAVKKKNPNLVVSLDICKIPQATKEVWQSNIGSWLKHVNYFWPNHDEALQMLNDSPAPLDPDDSYEEAVYNISPSDACKQIMRDFMSDQANCVAITCGRNGAEVIRSGSATTYRSEAYKINSVKDATGAGDSWCAGFIYATLNKKMSVFDAADFANATAASCIREFGSVNSVPDAAQVASFIEAKPERIPVE